MGSVATVDLNLARRLDVSKFASRSGRLAGLRACAGARGKRCGLGRVHQCLSGSEQRPTMLAFGANIQKLPRPRFVCKSFASGYIPVIAKFSPLRNSAVPCCKKTLLFPESQS